MASSASLAMLVSDLQQLGAETKRKHTDIKEAADKALMIAKTSPDQVLIGLRSDVPSPTSQADDVLKPVFMGCATKNPKVVAIALGSLQRLIGMSAVPKSKIPQVVATLSNVLGLGVEIQLRILQTLPSLLMNFPLQLHATLLSDALFLCFRLQDSRVGVVSSTAAATLRQLVMVVFDGVVDEDRAVSHAKEQGKEVEPGRRETDFVVIVPSVPATSEAGEGGSGESRLALRPSAKDAYLVFEDLCLLVNGDPGSFLKLQSLPKTFGLELIESVMTGHGSLFQRHPELIFVLRAQLCPLLIRALSDRPTFALTLRLTRVAFLLLKQFADQLRSEAEVFLSLLIKMISTEPDHHPAGGGPSSGDNPPWLRILALEIFRGLCADFDLLIRIYDRYGGSSTDPKRSQNLFSNLMAAFNRLASEKPHLLGINNDVTFGTQVAPPSGAGHPGQGMQGMIDGVVGMATQAAAPLVTSQQGSLTSVTATMRLQCIDQLDKAEAPAIPETYAYLLALQCLTRVAEGFASFTLSLYGDIVRHDQQSTVHQPPYAAGPIEWDTLPAAPRFAPLKLTRGMADVSWPALLASLSFYLSVNLDDDLFGDCLSAIQRFTEVCGVLGLDTPRDAFLGSLCKFAVPPAIVAQAASSEQPSSTAKQGQSVLSVESLSFSGLTAPHPVFTLSSKNFACLRALLAVAQFLAGSLDGAWFTVFEVLQSTDFVLAARRKKRPAGSGAASGGPAGSSAGATQENEEVAVQANMQKLFEGSKNLDDRALKHFIGALCRLSTEMVGFPKEASGNEDLASPVETPRSSALDLRRRQSGMDVSKHLRQTEQSFGVSKLGSVAMSNVSRLVTSDPSVAWTPITAHLLTIQRSGDTPLPVRLQATDALDQLLLAASRHDAKGDEILQRTIQTQVVEALAQQGEAEMRIQSSGDVEVRKRAFDTLFKILETNGHSLSAGWRLILDVLHTACPSAIASASEPPSSGDLSKEGADSSPYFVAASLPPVKNSILVRTAFPALHLICTDFLSALDLDDLRHCIAVLTDFGGQVDDINIALTATGLLWQVSDHIQSQKTADEKGGDEYVELWMHLLASLLRLCRSDRQEIRDGAIQTLFRTIGLYAGTLSDGLWDRLLRDVVFALLDFLSAAIDKAAKAHEANKDGSSPIAHSPLPNGEPQSLHSKQLDDSKVLAFDSIGRIFHDYLASHISRTSRFSDSWARLVWHVKTGFIRDRPKVQIAATKALILVLQADFGALPPEVVTEVWLEAWKAFEEMGSNVTTATKGPNRSQHYTQASLESYISVAQPLQTKHHFAFSLDHLRQLLAICHALLLYPHSPDYRPDVDVPSPLQSAVLKTMDEIPLEGPGFPGEVITSLAEIGTLAFVAGFEGPSAFGGRGSGVAQKVTHVGLCKAVQPKMVEIFAKVRDREEVYREGAVARIFSSFTVPLKLKYDCPPSARHGSDPPLWKSTTDRLVVLTRQCLPCLSRFGPDVPGEVFEELWRQVVEAYRGALLADCSQAQTFELGLQREEEDFDLRLLASIELDVLPHLGDARVPDSTVLRLFSALQSASLLYTLDATSSLASSLSSTSIEDSPGLPQKETRFVVEKEGTTVEPEEKPRERFGYWNFDLLFMICTGDEGPSPGQAGPSTDERKRLAALGLPSLLERCRTAIEAYTADAPLRGRIPFPRVREEELVYILQRLLGLRLWTGSLYAAFSPSPSKNAVDVAPVDLVLPPQDLVAATLDRSPVGHLTHLYPLLIDLLSVLPAGSTTLAGYAPSRRLIRPKEPSSDADAGRSGGLGRIGRPEPNGEDDEGGWQARTLVLGCLSLVGQECGFRPNGNLGFRNGRDGTI